MFPLRHGHRSKVLEAYSLLLHSLGVGRLKPCFDVRIDKHGFLIVKLTLAVFAHQLLVKSTSLSSFMQDINKRIART